MNAVHVPCSGRRHGIPAFLDIYRYTLARRYAGALVYYLVCRRSSHFDKINSLFVGILFYFVTCSIYNILDVHIYILTLLLICII